MSSQGRPRAPLRRDGGSRTKSVRRFGQDARHGGWQATGDLCDVEEVIGLVDDVEAVDRDGGRYLLQVGSETELRLAP